MGDVLVVVDMQNFFLATKHVLNAVAEQIILAKKRGDFIAIVESAIYGRTNKRLCRLVKGYKHHGFVQKHGDNGSDEVFSLLYKHKWSWNNFYVVGVNKQACVSRTAMGLATLIHGEVHILDHACYGFEGKVHCPWYMWQFVEFKEWTVPWAFVPKNLFVQLGESLIAADNLKSDYTLREIAA